MNLTSSRGRSYSGQGNSFISGTTDRTKSLMSLNLRSDKCVIVLGSYGVGKSSLISRYILEYFPTDEDKSNLIN
jgi:GTPase SAR1 family protein